MKHLLCVRHILEADATKTNQIWFLSLHSIWLSETVTEADILLQLTKGTNRAAYIATEWKIECQLKEKIKTNLILKSMYVNTFYM